MATRDFITLPDKLSPLASSLADVLKQRGYSVRYEPSEISLPSTPALSAKRNHEKLYVLVKERLDFTEVRNWHRYCQSCSSDTRIAVCVSEGELLTQADIAKMSGLGVGLVFTLAEEFHWSTQPRDIAFHAQLPDRRELNAKVRILLGEALDRFDEHEWRTGFENACLVFEDESRKYLLRNVPQGRIKYLRKSKLISPTRAQIRRMTLGTLKLIFCNLHRQNQLEAKICAALDSLNPQRIRRIHNARSASAERTLRHHVGVQMWTIINALGVLVTG